MSNGPSEFPLPEPYITRPDEIDFDRSLKAMRYVAVLGPRRGGKTRLLHNRVGQLAQDPFCLPIHVSLREFSHLDGPAWYRRLQLQIIDSSGGRIKKSRAVATPMALRQFLLQSLADELAGKRLILMLDEVESIPDQHVLIPLMSTIRWMHENRGRYPELKRCTFVLAGRYIPEVLVKDRERSPFAFADRFFVRDPDHNSIVIVIRPLSRPDRPVSLDAIDRIFRWTEGDLFLVDRLCQMIDPDMSITPQLIDLLVAERLITDHFFDRIRDYLVENPEIVGLLRRISEQEPIGFSYQEPGIGDAWLEGLIKPTPDHYCRFRNPVYELWLRQNQFIEVCFSKPRSSKDTEPTVDRLHGVYQYEAPIAGGGQARVYKAIDTNTGKPVAIKNLYAQLAEQPEWQTRFDREKHKLASLDHPHIIKLVDAFIEKDRPYLVMEYWPRNLRMLMTESGGAVPETRIARITMALCKALSYIHERKIIHRDIKPENILLRNDDWPLLADFGIAWQASEPRLTVRGQFIGTPAYMSPELYRGYAPSIQSDLFALGVVLYELITGRLPFDIGLDDSCLPPANVTQPAPVERTDIQAGLVQIAMTLLQDDPNQRYRSSEELFEVLRGLYPPVPGRDECPV